MNVNNIVTQLGDEIDSITEISSDSLDYSSIEMGVDIGQLKIARNIIMDYGRKHNMIYEED
jgi:hypothetical protein